MNRIVCFDSMVFNYAFRDEMPTPGTDEYFNFIRVKKLTKALNEKDYLILVPTIVLAEAACIFTEARQNLFFSKLPGTLLRGDFTESTSRILSRVLHDRNVKTAKEHTESDINNRKMKYDSLILAISVEAGCDCLYTLDTDFYKYSTSFIEICSIDESPPGYSMGSIFQQSINP